MTKAAFKKKFCQEIRLKRKEKTSKMLHRSIDLYTAEIWTLRIIEQKYLESLEMWGWRRLVGPKV
jgi:hypothetical protein